MVPVRTTGEVLAIADALERAAASRYAILSDCMRRLGHGDVAMIFEALAEEERSHVESVQKLSKAWHVERTADVTDWVLPDTFELEQAGQAALLTPYTALSIAVRGEERAFSFWTYVASETDSEEMRAKAELMAHQELIHAAKLRHERRRAYHAGGYRPKPDEAALDPESTHAGLWRQEAQAAGFLASAADRLAQLDENEIALIVCTLADELCATSVRASESGSSAHIDRAAVAGPAGILFEAAGVLEQLTERYLDVLGRSADALMVEELGRRAKRVTDAIGRLNARLYELEPGLSALASHTSSASVSKAV